MSNQSSLNRSRTKLNNPINGFLLVNKPAGVTSFDVVRKVRKITTEQKVGHCGTLDPFATGLLILALGRPFTKQIFKFQCLPKTYQSTMVLGIETDTHDIDGKVSALTPVLVSNESITSAFTPFKGDISQIPPQFSAKKLNGKRAYSLARKGLTVKLDPVTVTIHDLSIQKIIPKIFKEVEFELICSSGTYVRSLARDIGYTCQCGAILKSLSRVAIGSYASENAISYDSLTGSLINDHIFSQSPKS
ncbi:MAG: tRNA pseudouridine(55) synthase TruB [Candidatus Margulisbacteria bacterium]|nr:tRNA pseudouridine(55) synthase TruB [Candidatus Margulisiibacteriota bacterium]